MNGAELAEHRRQAYEESLMTDSLVQHLEYRVAALEEIVAARWPRKIIIRRRLARRLRASVRGVQGATFAERRSEAAGLDWLASR